MAWDTISSWRAAAGVLENALLLLAGFHGVLVLVAQLGVFAVKLLEHGQHFRQDLGVLVVLVPGVLVRGRRWKASWRPEGALAEGDLVARLPPELGPG